MKLTPISFAQLLAHPSVLHTALSATSSLGWSTQQQNERIIIALRKDEAGDAASRFRTLDDLISNKLLEPHKIKDPKSTCAYLCYSSGTSGKAKGVLTSHFNVTVGSAFCPSLATAFLMLPPSSFPQSVLTMFEPLKLYKDDVHVVVLPMNRLSTFSPSPPQSSISPVAFSPFLATKWTLV